MTTRDFLECIDEVRQSAKHEQDMFYLTKPPGKDSQEKAAKRNGKTTDEDMLKEVETFEEAFLSYATHAPASATDGQPVSDKGEDFCALCGQKKTTKQHNFILGCRKLKSMKHAEVKAFYDKNNCKCTVCFNQNHAVNECNLPRRECSNKIVKAFKDKKGRERKVGEVCNAPHNIFLCKQRASMEAAAEN